MIPLFTELDFNAASPSDNLLCQCEFCHKSFNIEKRKIKYSQRKNDVKHNIRFCSLQCKYENQNTKLVVNCLNCNKQFLKILAETKRNSHHFCSRSCSAIYHNAHKTKGNRRSKLEIYLENELTLIYPQLEIHYNNKNAINAELDIYIPSLKLAFELNGIFHYEPIFGKDKLTKTQTNDQRKFQACLEKNIELCTIDTSSIKYFKPKNVEKYIIIIKDLINQKLKPIIC